MITIEYSVYLFILLTGFVLGLFKYRIYHSFEPVIILLGCTLISECLSRILAYKIHNSNPPYHFLTPLQCVLWGVFFFREFRPAKIRQTAFWICQITATASILNTIFFQHIHSFPSNLLILQSFLFVALGFLLFMEKMDEPNDKNIFKEPGFLVSLALILFNIIAFAFNTFHDYLLENLLTKSTMRLINYTSNYLYYTLILISIILLYTEKNELTDINAK